MHKAWRFFDFLVWLVANGSHSELADFFAQPEQFRLHYRETALLFTDQIPVWLKVEAGASLVSKDKLTALRVGQRQRRAKRAGAKRLARCMAARAAGEAAPDPDIEPEDQPDQSYDCYLSRGPGDANATRWRLTLIARQAVEGFWNPACCPQGH